MNVRDHVLLHHLSKLSHLCCELIRPLESKSRVCGGGDVPPLHTSRLLLSGTGTYLLPADAAEPLPFLDACKEEEEEDASPGKHHPVVTQRHLAYEESDIHQVKLPMSARTYQIPLEWTHAAILEN